MSLKTLLNKAKWYVITAGLGFAMALALLFKKRKSTSKPAPTSSFDPRSIPPEPVPVTRAERVEYLRKEGLVK